MFGQTACRYRLHLQFISNYLISVFSKTWGHSRALHEFCSPAAVHQAGCAAGKKRRMPRIQIKKMVEVRRRDPRLVVPTVFDVVQGLAFVVASAS